MQRPTGNDSGASANRPAILGGTPVRPQGPPDWPFDDPAVTQALHRALAERTWGKYHGPNGPELVRRLRDDHGCEHVLLCCSGTAAVELALRGLKVGPRDEVILAAYDFKGNFQNVLTVGARPVLIDVHPANWNMDVAHLEAAIGPETKAIIVSHLHGGVVPMQAVMDLARHHGLAVIEDACQMPGAIIDGRKAGTWGDVGVLSFGGSKLLSAGRGGALLTDDERIIQRARLYTYRGNEAYPISELQAAVLLPQLELLDERNVRRAQNVSLLCELLDGQKGMVLFRNPTLGDSMGIEQRSPGYYKLGIQYDPGEFGGLSRDDFAEAIRAEGIALDAGFRSLHLIHSGRRYRQAGDLPNATKADQQVLALHHPVLLGTEDDIRQIVQAVEKVRGHADKMAGCRE